MPRTDVKYTRVVAFRLTIQDDQRLRDLCRAIELGPADALRAMLRAAALSGVPPIVFAATAAADHSEEINAPVED